MSRHKEELHDYDSKYQAMRYPHRTALHCIALEGQCRVDRAQPAHLGAPDKSRHPSGPPTTDP
ncbi:hypothetical protein ACWF0M_07855 [Kribbella sp. NPDC055110]